MIIQENKFILVKIATKLCEINGANSFLYSYVKFSEILMFMVSGAIRNEFPLLKTHGQLILVKIATNNALICRYKISFQLIITGIDYLLVVRFE